MTHAAIAVGGFTSSPSGTCHTLIKGVSLKKIKIRSGGGIETALDVDVRIGGGAAPASPSVEAPAVTASVRPEVAPGNVFQLGFDHCTLRIDMLVVRRSTPACVARPAWRAARGAPTGPRSGNSGGGLTKRHFLRKKTPAPRHVWRPAKSCILAPHEPRVHMQNSGGGRSNKLTK